MDFGLDHQVRFSRGALPDSASSNCPRPGRRQPPARPPRAAALLNVGSRVTSAEESVSLWPHSHRALQLILCRFLVWNYVCPSAFV
jgi:hypothetical protein